MPFQSCRAYIAMLMGQCYFSRVVCTLIYGRVNVVNSVVSCVHWYIGVSMFIESCRAYIGLLAFQCYLSRAVRILLYWRVNVY